MIICNNNNSNNNREFIECIQRLKALYSFKKNTLYGRHNYKTAMFKDSSAAVLYKSAAFSLNGMNCRG